MATVPEAVTAEAETHRKPPFLRRVQIRNYKSIKFCDVKLEPLTVLVGRNGSGKSNFVEALAFLRDVVTWGVEKAVTLRHGPIQHKMNHEAISITIECEGAGRTNETNATYAPAFRYRIELDNISVRPQLILEKLIYLENDKDWGITVISQKADEKSQNDRHPQIASMAYESRLLSSVYDYNFVPGEMRRPQRDVSSVLAKSGINIANILNRTKSRDGDGIYRRIQQYLSNVVAEIHTVTPLQIGEYETVEFTLEGGSKPLRLDAASMSDGTLRVLATLVAAYQSDYNGPPSLVAIEEPETSLHPAAMHALVDALDEATGRTQILLTTHSTELLDNPTIRPENVRVVEMVSGETVITPVDEASVEIVKQHLDTLGGLERQNQLSLNLDDQERQRKLAAGSDVK